MHTPEHHARWIDEPNMHECLQVPDLLKKITELKQKGLTTERVAFSFMKRRIQPLMKRKNLSYEYTSLDDASRIDDICDDLIMERLQKIFKNLEGIPAAVEEYSAANPPKPISSREHSPRVLVLCVSLS